MSSEPIDRKIEFIIEQQAAFSVKMEQMQESQAAFHAAFSAQIDQLRERQTTFHVEQEAFRESLIILRDQDAANAQRIADLNDLALSMFRLMSDQGLYISDVDSRVNHIFNSSHRHDNELDSVRETAEKQSISIEEIRNGYAAVRKQIATLERKIVETKSDS